MAWVYMLKCVDDSIYVGSTNDLDARLWQHEHGLGGTHTSRRRPVELIWAEEFERIDDAFWIERKLHGWSREKKLLFSQGRFDELSGWSQREQRRRGKT